jgi:UTP-glucose-1-phosphate uridylyltransferase
MYPASKACAKALMPLVDVDGVCKPILHVIIEEALQAMQWDAEKETDIRIAIVVHSLAQQRAVESYFSAETEPALRDNKKLQPVAKRMADIGKLLDFVLQEKQLVSEAEAP